MLSALNYTFALWKNRYGVGGGCRWWGLRLWGGRGQGVGVEVVELGTGIVGI